MTKYLALLLAFCSCILAQLTPDQKLADFQQLASLYAKHYAPYEWKRDVIGFDLYNIEPWLHRVRGSQSDLDFYEICVDYISSLNDGHDVFQMPTDFMATLGFRVDLYDNVPLVDSINRAQLPASDFPIAIGDQLISIDGVGVDDLIHRFARYAVAASDRSTARFAALYLTIRPQVVMPHAAQVPTESLVVLRSAEGETKTLSIPWTTSGTPLQSVGPVPSPKKGTSNQASAARSAYLSGDDPGYMLPLRMIGNMKAQRRIDAAVSGFGAVRPVYRLPEGFVQRLGRSSSDSFFSGTWMAEGKRIGLIRIPYFDPASLTVALNQFAGEIQYMQTNVDGMVIDVTRNPGGNGCYAENLLSLLIPVTFRTVGVEIRATSFFVQVFSEALEEASSLGAPTSVVEQYQSLLDQVKKANSESRGKTGAVPLCSTSLDLEPARDRQGRVFGYNKPLMLLTDDMSASAAELFAADIQDSWRGPIFGWRTMGLGGSVGTFYDATTYSEGTTGITWTQMVRPNRVSIPGYPSTNYVENVGIHPDIRFDPQTRENLMNGYQPFVDAFTRAMLDHIAASQ